MKRRRLVILYGSQSGTAQDIAERLWRESRCFGFVGPVLPMDDYDVHNLIKEQFVVFVCSTTGQGDTPDNMKHFWRFLLRKALPADSLKHLEFGVLGLGDSSYSKYNYVGKKLYRRLLNLGATPLCELGLADDQHDLGIDAVVEPWMNNFWSALLKTHMSVTGLHSDRGRKLLPARWNVETDTVAKNGHNEKLYSNSLRKEKCENSSLSLCVENCRVTPPSHFQDVRLMKFVLSEKLHYTPGDILQVKPVNSEESVKEFFTLFSDRWREVNEDLIVHVKESYTDMPVPVLLENPLKLKTVVHEYWDLSAVPRRYAFELMSHFTDSDLEREKLIEFTSPEGQQDLYNYCNRPKRTILEVLADFPRATANIPFNYFFELFQPIRPRAFSIASSPKAHPGEVHILVAVVKYRTNLKNPRLGLCSNWLAQLKKGAIIPVQIKKGSFAFPIDPYVPVIMVGPGTGIAPFRSFTHEDVHDERSGKQLYVHFGCRYRNVDFYFKDEWTSLQTTGRVFVYAAFSRDQPEKFYVQDMLKRNSLLVWQLLSNPKTCVYVAGNAKNMPTAVRNVFMKIVEECGNVSSADAEKFLEQMELKGRYQTETWS